MPDRLPPAHLILFNQQTRMFPWQSNAKPDEREQWVRQPVHPAEAFVRVGVREYEIQPHVEEFIRTQPRNVVGGPTLYVHGTRLPQSADLRKSEESSFLRRESDTEMPHKHPGLF